MNLAKLFVFRQILFFKGLSIERAALCRLLSSTADGQSNSRGFVRDFIDEFSSSLKRQYDKNKELHEGVGLLTGSVDNLRSSGIAKKIKKATDTKSKLMESITEAAENIIESEHVRNIGDAVGRAKDKVGKISKKVSDPIANTVAAKAINTGIKYIRDEVSDPLKPKHYEGSSRKSIRESEWRKIVESKLNRQKNKTENSSNYNDIEANVNAKELEVVELKSFVGYISKLQSSGKMGTYLSGAISSAMDFYARSKDVLESITNKFQIEESEDAKVVRVIQLVDPEFEINTFSTHANNYIIPSILEAYLDRDFLVLSEWSDVALIAKLKILIGTPLSSQKVTRRGKLIDLRDITVQSMSLFEDKIPIITLTFQTNEVYYTEKLFGNKTRTYTDVETAVYSLRLTKAESLYPESEINIKTDGWLLLDIHRSLR